MKKLRSKFRRSLAGFLAFCVTATSFNTVSWADVGNALDTQSATFIMSGEDLKDSAQAAVDEGKILDFDDLGITSEEGTSKEYKKLFEGGSVYEFMPSYDTYEEENADGAFLRMFIRVKDRQEGYQLTGNEKIIFLYINDSEGTIKFRTDIDGYLTERVSVKGNTFLLDKDIAVPGGNVRGENQVPGKDVVEEETTAPEETPDVIPDTTIVPSESEGDTESAVVPEKATEAPEETSDETSDETIAPDESKKNTEASAAPEEKTSESKEQNSDHGSEASELKESAVENKASETGQISMSRHLVHVLTAPIGDTVSDETATPGNAVETVEDEEKNVSDSQNTSKKATKGEEYRPVIVDGSYYAKAYVVTLKDLMASEKDGLTLIVSHHAYYNDEEKVETETLTGFDAGEEVFAGDYSWSKDTLEYLGSSQDHIIIGEQEENKLDLYYEEIVPDKEEEDVVVQPKSYTALKARSAFSLLSEDSTTPGMVFPTKTAQWVDENNGIAKIEFSIFGNPIRQGSDVVLVIDSSGSMAGKKWTLAVNAARAFITNLYKSQDGVDSDNRLAIVDFDSSAARYPSGSGESFIKADDTIRVNQSAYTAAKYFTDHVLASKMSALGGTNYDVAFAKAEEAINGRRDSSRPAYIVFMSDGEPRDNEWSPYRTGAAGAERLRNDGVMICSLGLDIGNTAFNRFIKPLASEPKNTYAKNIKDINQLPEVYNNIASSIKIAGTSAVITDVINTDAFEIVSDYNGDPWYDASTGTATKSADGRTVTWNFGNISENKETLTIYIRVKKNVLGGTSPYTNKNADVTYKDPNYVIKTKDIPNPRLPVGNVGNITRNYYLVNKDGYPISSTETTGQIVEFSKRVVLGTDLYESDSLPFGTYAVPAPAVIQYDDSKYQYVAASAGTGKNGSPNPSAVSLNAQNKAVNLYFGYQLISDVTVTFDGNGGTPSVSTVTIPKDTALGDKLAKATRDDDYIFMGWNTSPDGKGTAFTEKTIVSENKTVYAQWKTKTTVVITADQVIKTYNGQLQSADGSSFTTSGLPVNYTLTGITAVGSGTDVKDGGYPIILSGSPQILDDSGSNVTNQFKFITVSGKLTIEPKAATIKVNDASKPYGTSDPTFSGTVNGLIDQNDLGSVLYARSNPGIEAVGSYPNVIVPAYTENRNYTVTVKNGNFEIRTASLENASVTGKGGTWEYDGAPHAAGAALKNAPGYTIFYQEGNGPWTTTSPSVTNVSEGAKTVQVKATRTGYVDLYASDITIKITPKEASIKVKNSYKQFDQPDPEFKGKVSGLINDADIGKVTYSRTNSEEGVGKYQAVLNANYTPNDNYAVTVMKGDFEIKLAKDPDVDLKIKGGSWPYDGKAHKVSLDVFDGIFAKLQKYKIEYSIDKGENWSEDVPSLKNVDDGTLTVIARGTRTGYEDLVSNEVTLSITPKAVTITVADASKSFDQPDPEFTGNLSGLVTEGDLGTISYVRTNDAEGVDVYPGVLDAKYTENSNYEVTVIPGTFEIKTASMEGAKVSAVGGEWPYDGNLHAITADIENADGYVIYYQTENETWTTTPPSIINVQEGTVIVSVKAVKPGYETLTAEPVEIKIIPKAVTITITDAWKYYGSDDPAFGGTGPELVNAGDLGTISYVRINQAEDVGEYEEVIDARYQENPNYSVTVSKGNFEIRTATMEGAKLTAEGGEWIYDGTVHEAKGLLKNADGYTIYYKTADSDWSMIPSSVTNVSEGAVTVSVKAVKRGYVDLTADDVTLKINPKEASIKVDSIWKFYGETDPAFTGTPDGLINAGDLGEIKYVRNDNVEDVKKYPGILDSAFTENSNYTVTVTKGDFEIKTASIPNASVEGVGGDWVYDGAVHAAEAKLNNADGYTVNYKVGNGDWSTTPPSVTNVSDGLVTVSVKAERTGYEPLTSKDITLNINSKPVTITADNSSKNFGEKDPVFTGMVDGLINQNDLGKVIYIRSNEGEESVAFYGNVIVPAYTANDNYIVTERYGNFEIKTASIPNASVEGVGGEWVYDGSSHAAGAELKNAPDYTVFYKLGDGKWTETAPRVANVSDGPLTVYVKAVRAGYVTLEAEPVIIRVTPKEASIKVDNNWKYFDLADPVFDGRVSGLVNNTDLGAVSYIRTNDDEGVGKYQGVLSAQYTSNSNYNVTISKGDFEIRLAKDPDVTLKIKGGSWPYDGKAHKASLDVFDGILMKLQKYKIEYSIDKGENWSEDVPSVENVDDGTLTVIARGTRTGYEDLMSNEVTLSITPKEVTITVADASKPFDQPDPVFTGDLNGLVTEGDLGTISYVRTNDAEGVDVYPGVLDAKYTENSNYEVTVIPGTFEIKTASMEGAKVSIVGGEWPYDGNLHAITAGIENGDGYVIYYQAGNEGWTTTPPSLTNVQEGTVTVSVKAVKPGYETLTAEPVEIKIIPKAVTITIADAWKYYGSNDPAFGGPDPELVNAGDLGPISYVRTNHAEDVGKYEEVLDARYEENPNYSVSVSKGTFEIKTATMEGAELTVEGGKWTYDGAAHEAKGLLDHADGYTIYYKVGDGEWSITPPSVANVSEGTMTVSVKAVRTGYEDLNADDVTLQIVPKTIAIHVDSSSKFYDQPDPVFSGTVDSLVNERDLGSISYIRTNTDNDVAVYTGVLDAAFTENMNYTVTVVKGNFEIKTATMEGAGLTAEGGEWTYDGAAHEAKGLLNQADGYTIYYKTGDGEWSTTPPSVTNVSDGTVTVSVKAARTGYEDLTTDDVTLKINAKEAFIAAHHAFKNYDDVDPEFTGTVDGLISQKDLGNITYLRSNEAEAVGSYPNVIVPAYTENSNYIVTEKNGDFEIRTASLNNASVTGNGGTWEYDGAPHAAGSTLENAPGYTVFYKTGDGEWTETPPSVTNVSEGFVTVQIKATRPGYVDLEANAVIIRVAAKDITIRVDSKSKEYGAADPEFTGQAGGLVAERDLGTIQYHRLEADQKKEDASDQITLTVSYNANENYKVTVINGELKIYAANNNGVSVAGQTVTYDGHAYSLKDAAALKAGSTLLYSLDQVTFSETKPTFTDAGTYFVYVKAKNPNYAETDVVKGTVIINRRPVTITADSAQKRYDGTALSANTAKITNGQLADDQKMKSVLVTGAQQSVGSSDNIASDAVISSGDWDVTANYEITYVAGRLTVIYVSSGSGENSGGGGNSGGSSPNTNRPFVPGGPGDNLVTITPDAVPLSNLPVESGIETSLLTIDDGNIPLAGLPKTGDKMHVQGLVALLSGILLAAYAALSGRKKRENQ
jgi:Mg-chelatase subunit ChlD/acylphosphatase